MNRNGGIFTMHDYQPLNLTQFCNVGTEFISEGAQPLIGSQAWHGLPFLAMPDDKNGLMPRYEGKWADMGARQSETYRGWPHHFYLWAWENRDPKRVIESVRLEPTDRKFIVAAITLGFNDEAPFPRSAKREVKITLPQPEDAGKPFKLEVDVDRGVATFPFPLPEKPANDFLADDFKGWGEAQNERSGQAYVEVAAIPSATITVKCAGEEIGRANWGTLQAQGKIETSRVQLEIVDRGRNWVHVTILDDETN